MIQLDFRLIDPLGYVAPDQLPCIGEAEIAIELFQCYLTFEVNGVDLSWRASIPMVDFARSMFAAACSLSPDNPEALFISVEYAAQWAFRLLDSRVWVSRNDLPAQAESSQAELIRATAQFGVRIYDALVEALPLVRQNAFLSRWYPYDEMKARC